MARQGNRPDSANSQFFINVKDNPTLNIPRDGAGYAVFGKVIQGWTWWKDQGCADGAERRTCDVPVDPRHRQSRHACGSG
jgi:cyclophilin family peptidyl-prolyl cis-trans isomerase